MEIKPSALLAVALAPAALLGVALRAEAGPPKPEMRPTVAAGDNPMTSDSAFLYLYVDSQSILYKIDKAKMKIVAKVPVY